MDDKDLIKRVKEDGVKFLSLQFTDVTGTVKSVDMPISGLEGAARRWHVVRWFVGGRFRAHSGK